MTKHVRNDMPPSCGKHCYISRGMASSSRRAAAQDLAFATHAFFQPAGPWPVWNLVGLAVTAFDGTLIAPLFSAKWDQESETYRSEGERDEFVAHAMVLLAINRLVFGWSRKRAAQQLIVWDGEGRKSDAVVPNLWERKIREAKQAGGRLSKASRHLAHEDNYYSFNQFYIVEASEQMHGAPASEKNLLWQRKSSAPKGFLHLVAEEAVVQWALTQPQRHLEISAEMLRVLFLFQFSQHYPSRQEVIETLLTGAGSMEDVLESTCTLNQMLVFNIGPTAPPASSNAPEASDIATSPTDAASATGSMAATANSVGAASAIVPPCALQETVADQQPPVQQQDQQGASPIDALQTLDEAQRAVGKRVRVYWAEDENWYEGILRKADNIRRKGVVVHVDYDDGDQESHMLEEDEVVLIVETIDAFAEPQAKRKREAVEPSPRASPPRPTRRAEPTPSTEGRNSPTIKTELISLIGDSPIRRHATLGQAAAASAVRAKQELREENDDYRMDYAYILAAERDSTEKLSELKRLWIEQRRTGELTEEVHKTFLEITDRPLRVAHPL